MTLKRVFLIGAMVLMPWRAALAEPPKLVVAILVDQMRYDYLDRFGAQFGPDGFKRFIEHGTVMTFARYNYCPTVTGPGHASFLSGATPAMHGIIANDWFDRRTGHDMYCAEDDSVRGVGTESGDGRRSPKNFIGSNFSDQMRLQFHSKVVGISMKDRGAILPAGKRPAGAYWFDSKTGNFVTSTYYRDVLPDWVARFNSEKPAQAYAGKTWNRLMSENEYDYPDARKGEGTLSGESKPTFPHVVHVGAKQGYGELIATPFGNELLAEFAKAAVEGERLGQGETTDVLCVSFSAVDYVGHRFGPYSQEVQDVTLRLDRQLAGLFAYLDHTIGMDHVAMVLTADHGVAPLPEFAAEQGMQGERFNESRALVQLNDAMSERFGKGNFLLSRKLYGGNLYLDRELLEERNIPIERATTFIRDWALSSGGFAACFSREQLLDGRAPGLIGRMVLNGFEPQRGGDVILVPKPYSIPSSGRTGTTHGSPYNYDTHVPVLFYGRAFRPGHFADEFYITDIVPTLCAALHVEEPPGCMGKPLATILTAP